MRPTDTGSDPCLCVIGTCDHPTPNDQDHSVIGTLTQGLNGPSVQAASAPHLLSVLYPLGSGDEWQMVEICGGNTSITLPNKVWRVNISHERMTDLQRSQPVWLIFIMETWLLWTRFLKETSDSSNDPNKNYCQPTRANLAQQLSFANIMAMNNSLWGMTIVFGPHRRYVIALQPAGDPTGGKFLKMLPFMS